MPLFKVLGSAACSTISNSYITMKEKKEFILRLIKNNLINTKLVNGLNELGLDAGYYHLSLSDIVVELMNIKINDEEFEQYLDLYEEVQEIDITQEPELLDDLAVRIYNHLNRYIKR